MWQRISLLVVGLSTSACAAATTTARPVESTGRNVITAAEIVGSKVGDQFSDLYLAVTRLRPEFVKRRTHMPNTPFTESRIMVYLNGVRYGPVETLSLIPLESVETIRYIRPTEANIKFGRAHVAGAIEVVTKKPEN